MKDSLLECFLENRDAYPILLPLLRDDKKGQLFHLRLHNGTIWRWNRPIIELNKEKKPYLRMEHRVNSAGPTIKDMIANIAFYIGLTHSLATKKKAPETVCSFDKVRTNFYQAAQLGLKAEVNWMNGNNIDIQSLILNELISEAKEGLKKLNIDTNDIDEYIDNIIKNRAETGQTGVTRPLRIEFPGAWCHVINRGLEKRRVYFNDKDRLSFLDLLGDASKIFKIEIHAYSQGYHKKKL